VASASRRTAWIAKRVRICNPSAVTHSASAATGSSGFVGAGGADLSVVGDWEAPFRKSPGSCLAYVQLVKNKHAAAMTVTSRRTAATPQFYGRPLYPTPEEYRDGMEPSQAASRR
jgi:hypothetical protein